MPLDSRAGSRVLAKCRWCCSPWHPKQKRYEHILCLLGKQRWARAFTATTSMYYNSCHCLTAVSPYLMLANFFFFFDILRVALLPSSAGLLGDWRKGAIIFSGDKSRKDIMGRIFVCFPVSSWWSVLRFLSMVLLFFFFFSTKVIHDRNGDSFSNKLLCLAILFKNKFLLFCNTQLSSFWNSFLLESFSVKD